MLFDSYIVVDWSAESRPKTGRDSIWICCRDADAVRTFNPRTRRSARILLAELLETALGAGKRILVGFDFPFGYPLGLAARLGLSGPAWRAVWDELAALLEDDERNANNRFEVAATLNRRVANGRFPFWGCPAKRSNGFLGPTHHRGHDENGLAERRLVDSYVPSAQPCWKLLGVGSVGSQALTGIPVVRALRDDPRWRERAAVWPFETGLGLPNGAQIVFAEVYPSLRQVSVTEGQTKDEAQVREMAKYFAECDRSDQLGRLFAGDPLLTAEERRRIETEEAWMLGLTQRRTRSGIPASAMAFNEFDTHLNPSPAGLTRGSTDGRFEPDHDEQARRFDQNLNGQGGEHAVRRYAYLRDPAEIYRRSFALIRAAASRDHFPADIEPLALRLAHAAGDTTILADLAWSEGAVAAGRMALAEGKPILVDGNMVAAGVARERLPAGNQVLCMLREPGVAGIAARLGTTRAAAAVELWRGHLAGAIVAIGNAPTALFHLLEIIAAGAATPALVLGFPVGFVGAAEAKAALAQFGRGIEFITLHGRRGGSALAAAAVNALAGRQ